MSVAFQITQLLRRPAVCRDSLWSPGIRAWLAAFCGAAVLAACSDPAPAERPTTATITVSRSGAAVGSVSAQGVLSPCGMTCSAIVPIGTSVTLAAAPEVGAVFGGWSGGGCTGTGATCTVVVSDDVEISARFDVAMFAVDVSVTGEGTVTSRAGDLACPGQCTMSLPYGTTVRLVATPASTSALQSWGGACSGAGACSFSVNARTTVTASFSSQPFELMVSKAGTGGGTVTSTPAGISCGDDCTDRYATGAVVALTAVAAGDSTFTGWSGACSGTGTCEVTMDSAASVTANFSLRTFALTVSKVGAGSGTVTSSPAGIACGDDCAEDYPAHASVALTPAAAGDSTFAGWSGACSGTGTCVVAMESAASVTASFSLKSFVLTVNKTGTGTGTVTSSPAGIACGADCTESYPAHTVVALTAAAVSDSTFAGWSGPCSGTGTCVVAMESAASVTASFSLKSFVLIVTKSGSGSGIVASSPAGIACGDDCTENYPAHSVVALTAVAAGDSTFAGWGGACTGTGTCEVTMENVASVTASFSLQSYALTVSKAGAGNGTVTSNPAGIACGASCSANYTAHTVVTLTAAAAADSTFAGWSGACSGTGTCAVTMESAGSVTASFALKSFALTVSKISVGNGTVTSSPAGISCGTDCTESYAAHTVVTLTPAAAADSTFAGWSGACSGTGTCVVTMESATSVGVNFALKSFALTVSKADTGGGTVTSSPAGISCGGDCTESYPAHTVVTLTATAASDSTFAGWSGACSGTGTCVVTMESAASVTASFSLKSFVLTVSKTGTGTGTVTSSPAGISCGDDCTESYAAHTVVTLTAVPGPGDITFSWSGACSGSGTCVVTMESARFVTVNFSVKSFALTVSKPGTGTGQVLSVPSGISCGPTCTANYSPNTTVLLLASEDSNSRFVGWSGPCSGTNSCSVTMDRVVTVTAIFNLKEFNLNVQVTGGAGTVTSSPDGIQCPSDCTQSYTIGTVVELTAHPSEGAPFRGWTGACSGTGTCQVTMTATRNVTASFSPALLAVANLETPTGISVFGIEASGNVAPLRVISGPATTLQAVRSVVVEDGEIFAVDISGNAITVFPVGASGNVAPVRRIAGPATGLLIPFGMTVFGGEIYVPTTSGSILVFPRNGDGDIAPSRVMTGIGAGTYLVIDNGEIYATDFSGVRILVFPVNTAGAVQPTRIISGPATGLTNPTGIHLHNGEIFVSENNSSVIRVFDQAAAGDVAPLRVIQGSNTLLSIPEQMATFADELYVAEGNGSTRGILVFPMTANGNVSPTRVISGSSTGLTGPLGVFVFF